MCTSQHYKCDTWDGKTHYLRGADVEYFNVLTMKYKEITPIRCGKCAECVMEDAAQWAWRCMKEAEEYENNIMLTLTYNDDNIPKRYRHIQKNKKDKETGEVPYYWSEEKKPKRGEIINGEVTTLKHYDMRLFLDKLRKHFGYKNLRYKLAGEYGEQFGRPHYHIIIFNLKVEDLKPYKYSTCEWSKEKNILYKSKTIDKLWGKGFVDLNEVNYETCCYVSRYIQKKWKRIKNTAEQNELETGRIPEYTTQSTRPGLGNAYYERNKEKFINEETFWNKTKKGLKEFKPGRYFDKQIEKENPELWEAIKERRKEKSKENWREILSKTGITKEEYIANMVSKTNQRGRFMKRQLV